MRRWLILGLAAAALAGLAAWQVWSRLSSAPALPPERFVVIIADSMRADHLGCYGSDKDLTPNLDLLAAKSIRFAECWAAGSWTPLSNAALLTGLYPHEVLEEESLRLQPGVITLADYFRDAGYKTAAFSAHPALRELFGFDQGFDTYFSVNKRDNEATEACLEWLREHGGERFFLLLYLFDPHQPYAPEQVSPELHDDIAGLHWQPAGLAAGWPPIGRDDKRPRLTPNPKTAGELSEADLDILHRLYQGEIRDVDRRIGRVLDALAGDKRTVIAFLSDHGEEFMEHGDLVHRFTLYRELLHVPFLLHVPGESPRVVDTPVSNLDLMPTFLKLAGIWPRTALRGEPLLPAPRAGPRPLFSETLRDKGQRTETEGYAVMMHDRALIHYLRAWKFEPLPEGGLWEYYDMSKDPQQQHPLPLDHDAHGEELQRLLIEYENAARGLQPHPESAPAARRDIDPAALTILKGLGYIAD